MPIGRVTDERGPKATAPLPDLPVDEGLPLELLVVVPLAEVWMFEGWPPAIQRDDQLALSLRTNRRSGLTDERISTLRFEQCVTRGDDV